MTKSSAQRRFICSRRPEGREQETKTRDRRWGRKAREQKKGERLSVLEDKGLPLDRAETDLAHGKMAAYKSKRGNPKSG